ncbi:MAG TPA: hypothetical protein VGI89_10950 [Rhizomicrobium sp.]
MRASAAVLLLLLVATPAGAQADMTDTANGFLATYGGFHPSDGIPNATGRTRLAPYLSPALNKLLAEGAAAEARFSAKVKGAPPLIEGDLFTSLFEGATSWKLGACAANGAGARCPVEFTHAEAKQTPVIWTDTLLLINTPQGWRVDDMIYGANFQFGNTGKLTDTLHTVLREAP